MELKERLKRIERLKSDKYIQMLLLGIRCFGDVEQLSEDVLKDHKAKNPTINAKMRAYRNDFMDKYGFIEDKFIIPASNEISEFIGEEKDDEIISSLLFDYSVGILTLDGLIEELKRYASL